MRRHKQSGVGTRKGPFLSQFGLLSFYQTNR